MIEISKKHFYINYDKGSILLSLPNVKHLSALWEESHHKLQNVCIYTHIHTHTVLKGYAKLWIAVADGV